MFNFQKQLRTNDWWNSKIPPLLAVAYLLIYLHQVPPSMVYPAFLFFIIWLIGAASFGHFLNDLFDIEADAKAGKPNAASNMSVAKRWGILFLLLVVTLSPWLFWFKNMWVLGLVVLHLLLFGLYSIPPVRLKERLWSGIVADALYAHTIPALIAAYAFNELSETPFPKGHLLFWSLGGWQFLVGFQNIILHQFGDKKNDAKAKVETIAHHWAITRFFIFWQQCMLPAMYVFFGLFLFAVFQWHVWILPFLFFVAYTFWKLNKYQYATKECVTAKGLTDHFGIINSFNQSWFPLLALLPLVFSNCQYYIILALLHLFLFSKNLEVLPYFKEDMKGLF